MKFFKSLYIGDLLFVLLVVNVLIFILAFLFPALMPAGKVMLAVTLLLLALDGIALYRPGGGAEAERICPDRFSNGDQNEVRIKVKSLYPFVARFVLIDELPFQFQARDFSVSIRLAPGKEEEIVYFLRPVRRGVYSFGALNVFASGPFRLLVRRYQFDARREVSVFPSFLALQSYELMAKANRIQESGIRRYRIIGHSQEFDQIRNYVEGDDLRVVNWKATARRRQLMVNQHQEERARQIYCVIDKGRSMELPFKGMSLLDYAINASLMLSHVALREYDKAGLITYNKKVGAFLKASSHKTQLNTILQTLYREKTAYHESSLSALFAAIWRGIPRRGLIFLFTNFESLSSLRRQLFLLRRLASRHLLVVVFFEDTVLKEFHDKPAGSSDDLYTKPAIESLLMEKERIARELRSYGVSTIVTSPASLTMDVINKYLELKAANRL